MVDRHQDLGPDCIWIGALSRHAAYNGVGQFVALVHQNNRKMLHLFNELGAGMVSQPGGEVRVWIPLHRDPALYPDTKTGGAFRDVYRLAVCRFGKEAE